MTGRAVRAAVSLLAAVGLLALSSCRRDDAPVPPVSETGDAAYRFAGVSYPRLGALLDSPAYQAHFAKAYRRAIGSRRFGVYENPRCESTPEGWRYRPRDALRPFGTDMDWRAPAGVDSNWSWHHHSLAIIDCYMARYFKDGGDPDDLDAVQAILQDWNRDNADKPANPQFSWGDHTTALRLRAVVYLYAALQRNQLLEEDFARELVRFIHGHTERLLRDERIIRVRHNHALDQVFAIALSHKFLPFLRYPGIDVGEEVLRRFEVERDHLLGDDGVETENSPAYHMWVPVRIATMERNLGLVRPGQQQRVRRRNNGSLEFATWIEQPDGFLPQIGDTAPGKRARIRLPGQQALPAFEHYEYAQSDGKKGTPPEGDVRLFPDSGYFIYRNDWKPPLSDDTHLVMKCGFLAEGHRHSDDGTLTLASRNEDWFVDTGMYGYQAGPLRRHALSPAAHNLSYLPGDTVDSTSSRRYERNKSRWGLSGFQPGDSGGATVTCTSFMYPDAIYKRVLSMDGETLRLVDTFGFEGRRAMPATRFNIPHDKDITLPSPGTARVCSASGDCIVVGYDPRQIADVEVLDGAEEDTVAFRTRKYLQKTPTRVLELRWRDGVDSAEFEVRL